MGSRREIRGHAEIQADLLILGGGGAGLVAALEAQALGAKVALISLGDGATPEVSALNVSDSEDEGKFFEDILRGGEFLNRRELVRKLAQGACEIRRDFEKWGIRPAQKEGEWLRRLASGSSRPRSIFMSREKIGRALTRTLRKRLSEQGVPVFTRVRACKILKGPSGAVCGVMGGNVETGEVTFFRGRAVIVATGGVGRLFPNSTYPADVVGDGLALAFEAGAELIDMEFVQFEPTVILYPPGARGLLMPTVMLGDGASLKNRHQSRFMWERDPQRGEKEQKHILAQAIQEEVEKGRGSPHGGVYFDCRMIPPEVLSGYSEVLTRLRQAGIDAAREPVEVGPMAHSFMGGIRIAEDGSTNIPGLYAAGEAAGGVWGANRIAGCGGTEIVVFGKIVGQAAGAYARSAACEKPDEGFDVPDGSLDPLPVFSEIQGLLHECAGMKRNGKKLEMGLRALERMEREALGKLRTDLLPHFLKYLDAAHACRVAQGVFLSALRREESRGFHYRLDCPNKNDRDFRGNILIRKDPEGGCQVRLERQDS